MAIQNEFAANLEFTNMFSSTSVKTYDDRAIKVPNTSCSKNTSQYFCICVSWDCLFDMSVRSFSMQQTPHHGQYCKFLLNIIINHIFYRYFLKILVILSSPPFYSTQINPPKVSDPVPNYIHNEQVFPIFEDALGAIDGSHFNVYASAKDPDTLCDFSRALTTNTLAICDFNMQFLHIQVARKGL